MNTKLLRAAIGVLLAVLTTACASAPQFDAKAVAMEWAAYMQRDYVLRPGDHLAVRVDIGTEQAAEADQNLQEIVVSPTGTIDLRRLPGPLQVAGRSIGEVRTLVLDAYKRQFFEPRVSVQLTEPAVQSVFVCGEVKNAGAIPFMPGMTMTQAIAQAGSFDITIKHNDVRVLRINPDGTQRTFRVNMEAVLLAESPDFLLLPGDVVYCQTSSVADVGNWVTLYIRRMLPFNLGGPALGTVK